ncbi:gliding motility protein GldN [Chryseosolibacter indicus]|uniref:Gliding motility protein GldN n=1 Tax=Chryseosolibacter indicus TaxID=2782351 RepID=A0ABS5VMK1_9BACT|nr:gliding motility protein GldN [Chryseosolibacter indicus]MBT1702675.1 gliding motility protein GldN [Chryseosolibacter indicus]
MLKRYLSVLFLSGASVAVFAQAEVESAEVAEAYRVEMEEQYNPNSINPIPVYEQHYKVRVWRNMDLLEKQNKGFFAKNGELPKLIMDAVMSGELVDIYASDSLTTKIGKDEFLKRLQQEEATSYPAWDPSNSFYTDDIVSYNGKNYRALRDSQGANPETSGDDWAATSEGKAMNYMASDVSSIQIVEDVIFDRRRSRLYYDVQAFELAVPGSKTRTGFNQTLGWFKYKDLEKLFRAHPQKAVWFNRQNTAQNKNFADAFLLRLFHGTINKIQNPEDETIAEQYMANGRPYRESVWAREWAEIQMMEREHHLWEF